MIITIQNTTKQMRVYQLDQRVAAGAFKGHSENVNRIDHDKKGNANVRRVRLRHGPVLRIRAGEAVEIPSALLHDPGLRQDTRGKRPPIKIVRRETPDEHTARKAAEAKAEEERTEMRKAAAQRQADHANKQGAETAPSTPTTTEEKAGSESGSKRERGKKSRGSES
jgi:hypothetical protein